MFCCKRRQVHVGVIVFIRERGRSRKKLQITEDWITDMWYMWLSASAGNSKLVDDNYLNYADFRRLFFFAETRKSIDKYKISIWDMFAYVWYRPVKKLHRTPHVNTSTIA